MNLNHVTLTISEAFREGNISPDFLPPIIFKSRSNGKIKFALSEKEDCYYTVTLHGCSCDQFISSVYPCPHQIKAFSIKKKQEERLKKEQERLKREQEERLKREQEERLKKKQEENLKKEQEENLKKEQELERLKRAQSKQEERLRKEQEEERLKIEEPERYIRMKQEEEQKERLKKEQEKRVKHILSVIKNRGL